MTAQADTEMVSQAPFVDAAVLSIQAKEYDGKRIQTVFSVAGPLVPGAAKAMGCSKKKHVGFMLGPKLVMGQSPTMFSGLWAACFNKVDAERIAKLRLGTTLEMEATVKMKTFLSPRGSLHDVIVKNDPK